MLSFATGVRLFARKGAVVSTSTAASAAQTSRLPATIEWIGGDDGHLRLLDQTRLPTEVVMRDCTSAEDVWDAIKVLAVRGAPAIGVAAAYGLCLGTRADCDVDLATFRARVAEVSAYLNSSRPTAVNLSWALRRMEQTLTDFAGDGAAAWARLLAEAHAIRAEDAETCKRIGEHGAALLPDGAGVLTHCNAGALATVAHGTALSLIYAAHAAGRRLRVFADETRPLLQGARLTAFELAASGVDVSVLCDNAAASLMKRGEIQVVVVGADRIAANGDVANKIGTYSVAVAARHHQIPFYVAAPLSTFDASLSSGDEIPIEQRSDEEIRRGFGSETVPAGVACLNPAFDVTPAELVTAIVTEKGVVQPVSSEEIRRFLL